MPDFTESSTFDSVRQIEITDSILGGDPYVNSIINSPINVSLQQLTNRTKKLSDDYSAGALPANADEGMRGLVRIATQAQVNTATSTDLLVTPAKSKVKIEATSPTPDEATTTTSGIVELADSDEATAGTSTTRVPSVDRASDMISAFGSDSDIAFGDWSDSGTYFNSDGEEANYIRIDNTIFVLGQFFATYIFPSVDYTFNPIPEIKSGTSVVGSSSFRPYRYNDLDTATQFDPWEYIARQAGYFEPDTIIVNNTRQIRFRVTGLGTTSTKYGYFRFFLIYETS